MSCIDFSLFLTFHYSSSSFSSSNLPDISDEAAAYVDSTAIGFSLPSTVSTFSSSPSSFNFYSSLPSTSIPAANAASAIISEIVYSGESSSFFSSSSSSDSYGISTAFFAASSAASICRSYSASHLNYYKQSS